MQQLGQPLGETRLQILSRLSAGERNLSDLARQVGRDRTTVFEHMRFLHSAGFVERKASPGQKWVFYLLTSKGRETVFQSRASTAAIYSGMLSLAGAAYLFLSRQPALLAEKAVDAAYREGTLMTAAAPPSPAPLPPAHLLLLAAGLALLAAGLAARRSRRRALSR